MIVDDESHVRTRLRRLLADHPSIQVMGECANGIEAVQQIAATHPDIVFLDIQMPGLDGFEVLGSLNMERMPIVVIVTAFDQHAIQAFEMNAIDYVLKPIDPARFAVAVERTIQRLVESRANPNSFADPTIVGLNQLNRPVGRLLVKSNGAHQVLLTSDIVWIQAADKYVKIHSALATFTCRVTMRELESRLDAANFVRVHRSTMVNINSIQEIKSHSHGDFDIILDNGAKVTLSRSYKAAFDARFHIGL